MRRRPFKSDFEVEVFENTIAVRFWPTRSLYTFPRFTTEREIAEFGPVSPDPVIQHGSRSNRTRQFNAAEVLAMAFRLATAAARIGTRAEPAPSVSREFDSDRKKAKARSR